MLEAFFFSFFGVYCVPSGMYFSQHSTQVETVLKCWNFALTANDETFLQAE